MGTLFVLGIALAVTALPFFLGSVFCRNIRMPEYGWKVGLILCALAIGGLVSGLALTNQAGLEVKRGIDLSGGVILIYQIDKERSQETKSNDGEESKNDDIEESYIDMQGLVAALARRINPSGVKEIVIRPYGEDQIEIIIPEVDEAEVETIKKQISQAGFLEFRIMADPNKHRSEIALAESTENRGKRFVKDKAGKSVAEWVPVGIKVDDEGQTILDENGNPELKVNVFGYETRQRNGLTEVLMHIDPFNVQGQHLAGVRTNVDEYMRPCVNFVMDAKGSGLLGGLTGNNQKDPQTGKEMRLGIILDGKLLSAPGLEDRISSNGRISGDFTKEEVESLVGILKAGRLPAVLEPKPISQNLISPLLGEDTIKKGSMAIAASLILVLIFMVIYYRFAGIVACFALVLNLLLILTLMIGAQASFSLAGLAGLVLTVGMSVDANVLIFERMREELTKGAALRMAIRNGFSRATTTIVDANVTTLITALVLYVIGTDQIRGFALTLILGILMSMFTAIFCSRVFFEIAERRRWITKVGMMQFLAAPNWNLFNKRSMAAIVSGVLILASLGSIVARGKSILDIDFLGGSSVQMLLTESTPINKVRSLVDGLAMFDHEGNETGKKETPVVTQMNPENQDAQTVYKVDSLMSNVDALKKQIAEKMSAENLLKRHKFSFKQPAAPSSKTSMLSPVDGAALALAHPMVAPFVVGQAETTDELTDAVGDAINEAVSGEEAAGDDDATKGNAQDDAPEETDAPENSAESDSPKTGTEDLETAVDDAAEVTPPIDPSDYMPSSDDITSDDVDNYLSETRIDFDSVVSRATVLSAIKEAAIAAGIDEPSVEVSVAEGDGLESKSWDVLLSSTPEEADTIFTGMKQNLEGTPVWLSSSLIGSFVANRTQGLAAMALLLSLVGIVAYIWFRFQHITFGLAAVVALVHDVIITLGAIALSAYVANALGFLLIEEFKISLPIVAALLTIIGYSLNDTIVVFDRIREVRGKSPKLTAEMINTSINQTLSRTILTSLTTLIVVAILYAFGGEGIHGFAFALMVGVLIGTYSSIFVASPALLWMSKIGGIPAETEKNDKKKKLAGSAA